MTRLELRRLQDDVKRLTDKLEGKNGATGERSVIVVPSRGGSPANKLPVKARLGKRPSEMTFAFDRTVSYSDLPHVSSTRLQEKLAAGDFVRFDDLLSDNRIHQPGSSKSERNHDFVQVDSFETWYEAFNVFLINRVFNRPEMLLPLIKYCNLIASLARSHPASLWL